MNERDSYECMLCDSDNTHVEKADCPCCAGKLAYVYCESCGAMFLYDTVSNAASMMEVAGADA